MVHFPVTGTRKLLECERSMLGPRLGLDLRFRRVRELWSSELLHRRDTK